MSCNKSKKVNSSPFPRLQRSEMQYKILGIQTEKQISPQPISFFLFLFFLFYYSFSFPFHWKKFIFKETNFLTSGYMPDFLQKMFLQNFFPNISVIENQKNRTKKSSRISRKASNTQRYKFTKFLFALIFNPLLQEKSSCTGSY